MVRGIFSKRSPVINNPLPPINWLYARIWNKI
jgi:hypothetical protein